LAPLKKGLPRQKKAEGVYAWRIFSGYFLFLAEKESYALEEKQKKF
jgi:hypothetical protein